MSMAQGPVWLGFWRWLLPPKAKNSTKGPKSHINFCPKAAFILVQIQKAHFPLLSLAFESKNYSPTTLWGRK
jgi:hypothetical protein